MEQRNGICDRKERTACSSDTRSRRFLVRAGVQATKSCLGRCATETCFVQHRTGLPDSPVYKHATAGIKSILDEAVGGVEMLKQILVIDIIDFYNFVYEATKLLLVGRELEDGEYMRDASLLQRFFAAQGEETTKKSESRRGDGGRLAAGAVDEPANVKVQVTLNSVKTRHARDHAWTVTMRSMMADFDAWMVCGSGVVTTRALPSDFSSPGWGNSISQSQD